MSLVSWLPLNGDLSDQGLANCSWSNDATSYITINNSGKIGKCYNFNSATSNRGIWMSDNGFMSTYINNKPWTLCAWIKTNATTTCVLSLSYGLRLFAGSTPHISLYNSDRTITCNSNIGTSDNVWHHIAATYDITTNTIKIYIDGVNSGVATYPTGYTYSSSWANGIFIGKDPNNSSIITDVYLYRGDMNDVRIYDNCLSATEIKEIAKGLVLHYPLKDEYIEHTTNYIKYPIPGGAYTPAWDASKHPNAITVSNWSGGYNGGVTAPNTGYHAYWKLIDDIATIVFQDKNSEIGQTHRWLGVSGGGLTTAQIYTGVTYTVSFDAKADVAGKVVTSGLYYKRTSDDLNGFHDGCNGVTLATDWKRYSLTYTCQQMYSITSLYIYGNNGVEGTSYVRNIQVEIKDHVTPYTSTSRSETTVWDCSGYSYNGTTSNGLAISNDSARYLASTNFVDSQQSIMIGNLSTIVPSGIFTFNIWFKKKTGEWSAKGYETILGGPSGFELEAKPAISNTPAIRPHSWGGSDGSLDFPYTLDQWNMLTMVRTTSNTKFYLNAQLVQTGTAGGLPSGNYFLGAWRDAISQNYRGYMSDARIYSTALSADDILDLYNAPIKVTKNGTLITNGEVIEV